MIQYDSGTWGIAFMFSLKGSVFPKATCWALPNAIMAVLLHMYLHPLEDEEDHQMMGVQMLWSGYTFVLGFLLVFRNSQAYNRFWEGCTLINQVKGEWFNAISSLIAFCDKDPDKDYQVLEFQNLIVRLGSLMYCSALQQVADLDDDTFEVIDVTGIDQENLDFLQDSHDRCQILMQWIQRLIVEAEQSGVIKIAPPILSRAYQELSRGIVSLNNVRKIKDIPFPFPYAQVINFMLLIHGAITPLLAAHVVKTPWWAAVVCFNVQCAFWSVVYIALEIEQPFGSDANDFPVADMQIDFNMSLMRLLEPLAQHPPAYKFKRDSVVPSIVPSTSVLKGLATRCRTGSIGSVASTASSNASSSNTSSTVDTEAISEMASDVPSSSLDLEASTDIEAARETDFMDSMQPIKPLICQIHASQETIGLNGMHGRDIVSNKAVRISLDALINERDRSLDGFINERDRCPTPGLPHATSSTELLRSQYSHPSASPTPSQSGADPADLLHFAMHDCGAKVHKGQYSGARHTPTESLSEVDEFENHTTVSV